MRGGGFSLRPARHDEVDVLLAIERAADARFAEVGHPELASGPERPSDAVRRAIDSGRITVAVVEGAPVGFVIRATHDGRACIAQLSVLASHGRRGVGGALLELAVAAFRAEGHATVVLFTQSDVPWNGPWYERHGFSVVPEAAWTPAMRAEIASQVAEGLDRATRVPMLRSLATS